MDELRVIVLGLGNLLCGDDGFGIHALRRLEEGTGLAGASLDAAPEPRLFPDRFTGGEVEFVDGGVLGLNLLPLVESCTHLLVLDAIDGGYPPGTVIELGGVKVPLYATHKLSEHQVSFHEVLALAAFRGRLPERLHVIGVQPADLSAGIELSAPAQAALDEVATRAARALESWVQPTGA